MRYGMTREELRRIYEGYEKPYDATHHYGETSQKVAQTRSAASMAIEGFLRSQAGNNVMKVSDSSFLFRNTNGLGVLVNISVPVLSTVDKLTAQVRAREADAFATIQKKDEIFAAYQAAINKIERLETQLSAMESDAETARELFPAPTGWNE